MLSPLGVWDMRHLNSLLGAGLSIKSIANVALLDDHLKKMVS